MPEYSIQPDYSSNMLWQVQSMADIITLTHNLTIITVAGKREEVGNPIQCRREENREVAKLS